MKRNRSKEEQIIGIMNQPEFGSRFQICFASAVSGKLRAIQLRPTSRQ